MLGATFCCRWMWGSCSVARKSISKDPEERRIYLGSKIREFLGVPSLSVSSGEMRVINRVNVQRFFVKLKISSVQHLAS